MQTITEYEHIAGDIEFMLVQGYFDKILTFSQHKTFVRKCSLKWKNDLKHTVYYILL